MGTVRLAQPLNVRMEKNQARGTVPVTACHQGGQRFERSEAGG